MTISDALPAGITFKTGSLYVRSGPNPGSKTDASGDDQAEYNGTNRTITFRLGTGADKAIRTAPIPVGDASPIVINVKGPDDATTLPLHVTVSGTDNAGSPLPDGDPSNDTVDRTTQLSRFGLAGGGLVACDCSLVGSSAHAAHGSPMFGLAGLLGLAVLVRSARRSRRSSTLPN